jgi:hypothetical protein
MENIIEPNETFDFTKLSLAQPTGIQGGAYFTKIQYNDKPLYIQTTKSLTRQGFVKTGKKYYCDLMFDNNSNSLIHWFENLEEKCIKLIYEKSDSWFQNALEMSDVESAFNSIIRIYKSGKFYLVRTNVKTSTTTTEPAVKIYNENEIPIRFEDINNETKIISILEIQGIKFTSRNFQIEIEVKQMMVLEDEPIFENCLIKTSKKWTSNDIKMEDDLEKTVDIAEVIDKMDDINEKKIEATSLTTIKNEAINNNKYINDHPEGEEEPLDIIIEELESEDPKELKEIDLDLSLENNSEANETITLKKPNQVYFELYKNARNKAKQAKKSLILAYLEAKNIKKTYMLDNLNDNSDSDLDAEIDEISESELEGL